MGVGDITYEKRWRGRGTEKIGIGGLLNTGILLFIVYLFLAGVLGFSSQMRWLAIIGIGIWWLSR